MTLKSVDTLLDVLHFADSHTAVVIPEIGIRVTYDALRQQVLEMAGALVSLGIGRGDAVAIALPNGLPAIVSFLAAAIAGTAAPLNPAYPYEEFLFFLGDTNARILLCPPVGAEFARSAAADRKIPVFPVGMNEQGKVTLQGAPGGASAAEPNAEDIALILHTSGSTGRPKRVPLRHFNLAVSSANIANTYALSEADVSLCIMPSLPYSRLDWLYHGDFGFRRNGGCSHQVQRAFILEDGTGTWCDLVFRSAYHASTSAGAGSPQAGGGCVSALHPFLQRALVFRAHSQDRGYVRRALRRSLWNDRSGASDDLQSLCRHGTAKGSVGVGIGLRISIMDKEGNGDLGTNQRGEVTIQGANVFRGYENNPEANARAFVNGWFRTGDEGMARYGLLLASDRPDQRHHHPRRREHVLLTKSTKFC
jgi:acyl-CoA synthetase (AMP-forming)/AMP-acid ligase II